MTVCSVSCELAEITLSPRAGARSEPVTVHWPASRRAHLLALIGITWYQRAVMRDNIRLVSSAGTGFTYYTRKNKRTMQGKLELKKYDPVVRKHVPFKEAKMPPHSK